MRLFGSFLVALCLVWAPGFTVYAQPEDAVSDPDDDDDGDVVDAADEAPAEEADTDDEGDSAPKKKVKKASKEKKKKSRKSKKKKSKKSKKKTAKAEVEDGEPQKAAKTKEPKAAKKKAPVRRVVKETVKGGDRTPIRLRASSVDGANGLDRIWSADPGPQGTFRLAFKLRYFDVDDWPAKGSSNTFTGTQFSVAWTPLESLETFLSVISTSNENGGSAPRLLQTQGDINLGVKGGWQLSKILSAGVGASVHFLSGLGSAGLGIDGLSYEARALFTADFHRANVAPIRLHLDTSYYIENAEVVFEGQTQEPDIIQEWALQAYRYDRLMVGLGIEVPANQYVNPFLEYRVGTPFLVELSRRGQGSSDFEFASVPHTLAAGIRAFPVDEIGLESVFRYGLSDQPFTGVAATPPWEIVFGLTYVIDPRAKVIEREVEIEKPMPAPTTKVASAWVSVQGKVVDASTGKVIPGAKITWSGSDVKASAQLANRGGRFGGYQFKAGQKVTVRAQAKGYLRRGKKLKLKKGKDRKIVIKLKQDPAAKSGNLEVIAIGPRGKMKAQVGLVGAESVTGNITKKQPWLVKTKPGAYTLSVSAKGYKTIKQQVTVIGGKTESIKVKMKRGKGTITLGQEAAPAAQRRPKPIAMRRSGGGGGDSRAYVKGKRVLVKGKLEFKKGTATLTSKSKSLLNAVASLMKRKKKLKKVRINVHTDGKGDVAEKQTLSTQQARAVKSYLVSRGVPRRRLSTKGYGADKPIAPNMSARGRARNRRVEMTILEMAP